MSVLKDDTIHKVYYSIAEVSKLIKVNATTLRFWRTYFYPTKYPVKKNAHKLKADFIDNFKVIYMLRKIEGYTLAGIEKQLNEMNKEKFKELVNEFNKRKLL